MARTEFEGIFVKIGADLTGLESGFGKAADMLSDFGDKMSEVGANLSTYLTVPIAALGTAIAKFGMDFEGSFAKVSTMFDEAKISSTNLQEKLLQLSDAVNVASTELNEGLYEALSSGIPITGDASDALEFMEKAVRLAKAGFTDLATAVDVDTSIMNSYGMSVAEIDRIHNALIVTQNLGKTTVDQLGHSLSNVVPTAAALGISIEQVGAAFAAITAQGVPTAQASTQIRAALVELSKSGTEADKAFRNLAGSSFKQFIAAGGTLQQAMQLIADGAKKSGLEVNDMFGSVEAANAALILASNTGAKNFVTAMETMVTQTGAVDEAFKKVTETTGERWSSAFNQMKNAAIRFFDAIAPGIEILADAVSYAAEYLSSFDEETQKIVVVFGALLAAIGPVTAAIGAIVSVIAALEPPVLIAVAGITALITALAATYKANEEFKRAIDEIISLLGQLGTKLYGIGQEVMEGLINGIESMISAIAPIVTSVAEVIISVLKSVLGIASPSKEAEEVGKSVGDGLVQGMDGSQSQVSGSAENLADSIKKSLKENLDKIEEFGEAIATALKNKYEEAYDAAKEKSEDSIEIAEDEYDRKVEILEDGTDATLDELEKQRDAVKETTDDNIDQYEREYKAKKKAIEDTTDAYIRGLEGQKDAAEQAVDDASEKQKDQRYENKKERLQSKLSQPGSYEDLARTQEELANLEEERNVELLKRKAKAEKESLQERINAAKDLEKDQKEQLKQELDDKKDAEKEKEKTALESLESQKKALQESTEEKKKEYAKDLENFKASEQAKIDQAQKNYKALTDNATLEAQKMLIDGNQKDILTLLEKYYPEWQNTGQSYADAMINGIKSENESASQAVNNLLNLKTVIPQQQAQVESLKKSMSGLGDSFDLTGKTIKSFSDTLKPITDAADTVNKTVETVKETFNNASNAVGNAGTSFSSFFQTMMQSIPGLQGIDVWFQGLTNSIMPAFQRITDSITKDSLPILQQIFDYISMYALPALSIALTEFTNTVLPPLIEVIKTAISSILDVLVKVLEFVTVQLLPVILNNIQTWLPTLVQILQGVINIVAFAMKTLAQGIDIALKAIKLLFDTMWPYITFLTKTTFENLGPIVDAALKVTLTVIQGILAIIKGDWETVFNGLGNIAKGALDAAGGVIFTALTTIGTMIKAFIDVLTQNWGDTWKDIGDAVSDVWDGIYNTINDTIGSISKMIGDLIAYIQSAISWIDQLNQKKSGGGGGGGGTNTGDASAGADKGDPFSVPDYLTSSGSAKVTGGKSTVKNSTGRGSSSGDGLNESGGPRNLSSASGGTVINNNTYNIGGEKVAADVRLKNSVDTTTSLAGKYT